MIIKRILNYYFIKKNIVVGSNSRILTSLLNFGTEPYLVEIGDDCTITSGTKFITHDASISVAFKYLRKNRVEKNKVHEIMNKIIIGNNCMVGVNTIFLPGSGLGDNCIVGAGSVVTKKFEDNSVIAGNPAKYICSIQEYTNKIINEAILIDNTSDLNKRKNDILKKLSERGH